MVAVVMSNLCQNITLSTLFSAYVVQFELSNDVIILYVFVHSSALGAPCVATLHTK